jgi:hypothetical protein
MKNQLKTILSNKKVIVIIYVLFAVIASVQALLLEYKRFEPNGKLYSQYNNYVIFKQSFTHLKNHQDLYVLYPEEHWDLYKYTPTFSVFFSVFSILPDGLGLNIWNLLNALVLLVSVYYLPRLTLYQKGIILLLLLIELMTSMQNAQSNALIAGLLILSFGLLERGKLLWATLCVLLCAFIKLFGIVGFALFLLYPNKVKSALYTLLWTIVLFVLPMLFVGFEQTLKLYKSYLNMLANDHEVSYGYSVMGWLHSWFSMDINKNLIVLAGVLIFLVPFYRIRLYKEFYFKYLILVSVLLWIVIFNHKAESPTFIIAMAGASLWFMVAKKNVFNIALFILAFIFTSLSPTDLFPRHLQEAFVKPYCLKGVPCIFIWFKVIYDALVYRPQGTA